MKLNDVIVNTNAGLYCVPGDFYIDPRKKVSTAVISHAHGDHAVPNNREVYCTAGTRELMGMRYNASGASRFYCKAFREEFSIKGVKLCFFPAGHILGSAQILIEYLKVRILYTGDFKLQKDDSCEGFEFVECDHLITETTFAHPDYKHPEPVKEIAQLNSTLQNIVVGAYAVGKAQRLTKLISENCPDKKIFVHSGVAAFHRVYEQHHRRLGEWSPYQRQLFNDNLNGVYILPPSQFARYSRNKGVLRVFATGWKRSYYSCDRILRISDHADWDDVLTLVARSRAKQVYTVHGDGSFLINHMKDTGISVSRLV